MAQFAAMELGKTLEALRAVRDPGVNAQGAARSLHDMGNARLLNVVLYINHDMGLPSCRTASIATGPAGPLCHISARRVSCQKSRPRRAAGCVGYAADGTHTSHLHSLQPCRSYNSIFAVSLVYRMVL